MNNNLPAIKKQGICIFDAKVKVWLAEQNIPIAA
jgi:hypothetical protein